MISNSNGYTGSGVLVGRNIVATAGHMVPWNNGNNGWIKFVPDDYLGLGSLYGQNVFSFAVEARGYNTNHQVTGYDWAILKPDHPSSGAILRLGQCWQKRQGNKNAGNLQVFSIPTESELSESLDW